MDLSYLTDENPLSTPIKKRMLHIGDNVILYSPSSVDILDTSVTFQKNSYIHPLTDFTIIDNIVSSSRSGIDENYITIEPNVNGHVFKGVPVTMPPIKLKIDIGNIKYITNAAAREGSVGVRIQNTFPIGETAHPEVFSEENFPLSKIDKVMEKNDRKLIDIYAENISNHYGFKEMEIELRSFQNEHRYGGYANTLNSYQYDKLIKMFSETSYFYKLTPTPEETLDITILNNNNLRITIEGRDKILRYCSTNTIPKTAKVMYKSAYEFKDDISEVPESTKSYYRHHFGKKTDNDLRKGVFNLYSLRAKLAGKIEIPFENKLGQLSINMDNLSNNETIKSCVPFANKSLASYIKLIKQRGNRFLKTFRLKSRSSFMLNNYIRVDLTKVKDSKKEVRQIGSSFRSVMGATLNFIDAEIVEQDEQYEFEIEILNLPEQPDVYKTELKKQLAIAINIVKYANAVINERPCFTHTNLKDHVLAIYKKQIYNLLKERYVLNKVQLQKEGSRSFHSKRISNYYISPKVRTLSLNEVQTPSYPTFVNPETRKPEAGEFDYTQYTDSIQVKYCVTDKADGLASMLFVYGSDGADTSDLYNKFNTLLNGSIFMIDSNMNIHNTNLIIDPLSEEDTAKLNKLIREKEELVQRNEDLIRDIDSKKYETLSDMVKVKTSTGISYTNKKERVDFSEEDAWDIEVMSEERDIVLSTLEIKRDEIRRLSTYQKGKWSLLNGEYLNFDKERDVMNAFAIYDVYGYQSKDTYSFPLITETTINPENPGSRIGYGKKFVASRLTSVKGENCSWLPLEVGVKKFENPHQSSTIVDAGGDTIFQASNRIWSNKETFKYKLDGLIYTPVVDNVGLQPDSDLYKIMPWRTWERNLKWKPPEDNTIDFLIQFRRVVTETYNGKTLYKNVIKGRHGSKKRYCVVDLYNKGKIGKKWKPILFKPKKYPLEGGNVLLEMDDEGNVVDVEGFRVMNDTIIEVSYEPDKPIFDRFSILRTRHDKTYQYRQLINFQKTEFLMIEKALSLKKKRRQNPIERKFVLFVEKKYFTIGRGHFEKRLTTIQECQDYYRDYSDIQTHLFNYNFGNSSFVALSNWDSIHNPVTEEMITTGKGIPNLEEISDKYYSAPYNQRSKSKTLHLQNFHNYIKKTLLIQKAVNLLKTDGVNKKSIRLLDLGCGKGGDIHKWRAAKIQECLGIDIAEDNISNTKDGALVRYSKMKSSTKGFIPNIRFLQLDVSKSLIEHLPDDFTSDTKFNIISSMYALHYCFKNIDSINGIILNISTHLEEGGYFIGTCFNGNKVFDMLRGRDNLKFESGGDTLLQIDKRYSDMEFDVAASVGLRIDVSMHSIGTTNGEYLVHFDYLKELCGSNNLELVEKIDYEHITGALKRKLSFPEKQMSNLNMFFIFRKKSSPSKVKAAPHKVVDASPPDSPPYIATTPT